MASSETANTRQVPVMMCRYFSAVLAAALLLVVATGIPPAVAQGAGNWSTDLDLKPPPGSAATPQESPATGPGRAGQRPAAGGVGTTVVKKKTNEPPLQEGMARLTLVALLTADGQRIEQDLVWRIFEESREPRTAGKLIGTHKIASPVLTLPPGTYTINAAFGRANLTRKITVAAGVEATEPFVLNAGGLRVRLAAAASGMESMKAFFDILSDERDQSGERRIIFSHAKPDTVIRLNSGIYHVVSTLGDANATVESDVTVESGKLTEATISHKAGRVTLKLVTRQGGEALPDTEWSVLTEEGTSVKTSVGALPTHILAPGKYVAVAKSQGRVFRRAFEIANGETIQVEVMRQ